jgi:hypothetical protein
MNGKTNLLIYRKVIGFYFFKTIIIMIVVVFFFIIGYSYSCICYYNIVEL